MKFLVSAFRQMGQQISDCMPVLCQKLHICTYNRPNFSGDWPPSGTPAPLQVLELPLISGAGAAVSVASGRLIQ